MKKFVTIAAIIIAAIIAWSIAAHYFGPNSERGIKKQVASLKQDSVALQENFMPKGEYTYLQDVCSEIDNLRSLGNPLRYSHTDVDSIRLFSNPITAALANYNIKKCDSVLNNVIPLWRATAVLALGRELKNNNSNTIVRVNKEYPEYTGIEFYSIKYLSSEEITNDASKYNANLKSLGFKSVLYSASPDNQGTLFTLN